MMNKLKKIANEKLLQMEQEQIEEEQKKMVKKWLQEFAQESLREEKK